MSIDKHRAVSLIIGLGEVQGTLKVHGLEVSDNANAMLDWAYETLRRIATEDSEDEMVAND